MNKLYRFITNQYIRKQLKQSFYFTQINNFSDRIQINFSKKASCLKPSITIFYGNHDLKIQNNFHQQDMIRRIFATTIPHIKPKLLLPSISLYSYKKTNNYSLRYQSTPFYSFATLPKHEVLTMPALSPTMSEGKIVQWLKKAGDQVGPGDIICEVETDKATVGFQVQEKGYIAKINEVSEPIPVGTPVVVLTKKVENVKQFESFKFDGSASQAQPTQQVKQQKKVQQKKIEPSNTSSFPKHTPLKLPALSPTMTQGKIIKWLKAEGQPFQAGDVLCSIETDKATVDFQTQQKGILAKILAQQGSQLPVGNVIAVSVRKKEDVPKFKNYTTDSSSQPVAQIKIETSENKEQPSTPKAPTPVSHQPGDRVFASPAAKTLAAEKGININEIKGSGPDGRIIKQDVEGYVSVQPKKQVSAQQQVRATKQQVSAQKPSAPSVSKKFTPPENPFEQIPLNNMRKTIANRLLESKTTIPHYYINLSVQMDALNDLRNELNKGQKENGVKISVNDIMIKAMALALRDYPNVNATWNKTSIKKYKHSDVGVAVATDGGLITPIVFRAETLGLVDIAKRTKDIAKRARQGKLDPNQYIGGTTTISNLGMFGIDSVISVINPPQSTILGVGQTSKQIIFDGTSSNPDKPYRVASMCQLIVSADHRVVDGALASQWLKRIQKYLQNPSHMLL